MIWVCCCCLIVVVGYVEKKCVLISWCVIILCVWLCVFLLCLVVVALGFSWLCVSLFVVVMVCVVLVGM